MILGLGIDTVRIERLEKVSDSFLKKCFHPDEIEEYTKIKTVSPKVKSEFLASRFAVKEAFSKAVGTGFGDKVHPCEIRTVNNELGKPYIILYGNTLKNFSGKTIHLSLSHEDPVAVAVVIIEGEDHA